MAGTYNVQVTVSTFGSTGTNLVSAVFTTLASLFFALSLKILRFKSVFLAAFTFAFVPVIFIHSTTTIDYMIALGFIMAGMYYMLKEQLIVAGILIGLAIGSRITSGAILLPFAIANIFVTGMVMWWMGKLS